LAAVQALALVIASKHIAQVLERHRHVSELHRIALQALARGSDELL